MPGAGQYVFIDQDDPEDVETTSNIACRSSPSLSASAKASQVAIMVAPRIMLLQILAACPFPAGPQCTAFWPMISNSGFAVAKAASLPPTMKVSVPAAAPPTPPETGASRKPTPAASASAATSRAEATSTVEQSSSTAPLVIAGRIPAETERRIAPLGSMVMTTSAPSTASAPLVACATPSTVTPATSKPVTSWPAATRPAAIGAPRLPNPMNPIFMARPPFSYLSKLQAVAAQRQEHGRDLPVARSLHRLVLPARLPVLVDDGRADAFEEVTLFHRP